MIKVGQQVRFDPFNDINNYGDATTTGTVIFVNPAHEYFTVEYEAADQMFRTSFKFNDLNGHRRNVFVERG